MHAPQQQSNSQHTRRGPTMQKRPCDLFISTTAISTATPEPTYKWSAPRPPTPRLNTFFSSFAIINAAPLQTPPPVPSLSFFEPDTPKSQSSPLRRSITLQSTRSRRSFDTRAAIASVSASTPSMAPTAIYVSPLPSLPVTSPLLSPGWLISTPKSPLHSPLWSPASESTTPSSVSSSNSSRSDLLSEPSNTPSKTSTPMSSLTSVAASISQGCSRNAKKAKLTLQRSTFHVFELESAHQEMMSPLLSPRFMWPRTPPAPPTIKSSSPRASTLRTSKRKSQNWYMSTPSKSKSTTAHIQSKLSALQSQPSRTAKRKSQNWYTSTPSHAPPANAQTKSPTMQCKPSRGKAQSMPQINVKKAWRKSLGKSLDVQTEAVGWGDIDSPVRLHFRRKSQLMQEQFLVEQPKAKKSDMLKESIQERRLKGMRSVQSLRSMKSVRSATGMLSPRLPRYQENIVEV